MKGNSAFTPARSRMSSNIGSSSRCASGATLMGMATVVAEGLAAAEAGIFSPDIESTPAIAAPAPTTPSLINSRRFMRLSIPRSTPWVQGK